MHQNRIVTVCPDAAKLDRIRASLSLDCEVITTADGGSALKTILLKMPYVVLLDVDLVGMTAGDFLRRLHRSTSADRPTIVLFGASADVRLRAIETHGLVDAVIQVPCTAGAFLGRFWKVVDRRVEADWVGLNPVQRALLKLGMKTVDTMVRSTHSEEPIDQGVVNDFCGSLVEAARSDDMVGVLNALKLHHNHTFMHALRVASSMTLFAQDLGMRDLDLMRVAQAGMLHDVGKIHIPIEILHKPGPLNDQEWAAMRKHPEVSANILRRSDDIPQETMNVALNHHERIDGNGYPRGLKSNEIDDLSLFCAISDVFVSLTEKRSYKPRMTTDESLTIMRDMAGHHLEPSYFAHFEEMVKAGIVQ